MVCHGVPDFVKIRTRYQFLLIKMEMILGLISPRVGVWDSWNLVTIDMGSLSLLKNAVRYTQVHSQLANYVKFR